MNHKNLLDMNDEKKIIIYQVFTRLFGNNNNTVSTMVT